jgi:hypothetical protein
MKKIVRLTECDLHKIINESVNKMLNELSYQKMNKAYNDAINNGENDQAGRILQSYRSMYGGTNKHGNRFGADLGTPSSTEKTSTAEREFPNGDVRSVFGAMGNNGQRSYLAHDESEYYPLNKKNGIYKNSPNASYEHGDYDQRYRYGYSPNRNNSKNSVTGQFDDEDVNNNADSVQNCFRGIGQTNYDEKRRAAQMFNDPTTRQMMGDTDLRNRWKNGVIDSRNMRTDMK